MAHGSAERCGARLAEYLAAGIDLPVIFPMPVAGDWGYEQVIRDFGSSTGPAEAALAEVTPTSREASHE